MWTKKGKYGLKALVYLAAIPRSEIALGADIAQANAIPRKFLETILLELKNAAFITSKKGKGGGYTLSRPATEIIVGDVVRLFEGPLAPLACASRSRYQPCEDCPNEDLCAVRLTTIEVRKAIAGVLDRMTIEDMRARASAGEYVPMYDI